MKALPPTPDEIRQALSNIVRSDGFSGAGRLPAFLTYLVEQSLTGESGALKETVVGVHVFQREPGYDPRTDPIVRVEARRLRARLDDYYQGTGASDPLRILLPKGGYAPAFQRNVPAPAVRHHANPMWIAAAAAGVIAIAAITWFTLRSRPAIPPGPATIAVLPFTNVGGELQNDYFSEGLSEEILDRLARVPGIKVVARSVMAQFRGGIRPLAEVAEQVHATVVVEGSVRRQGDRLRVTARLANPRDGASVWSQTYERQIKDVFAIQDEIAQSVANALRVRLRGEPTPRPTTNIDAYKAYLQGRHQLNLHSIEGMKLAVNYFEESLRLDPTYAPALASLSTAHSILGYYRAAPPGISFPNARHTAERAIQLAPQLPDAHAALGHILAMHDCKWREAEVEFKKAIELDDSSAQAHGLYALSVLMPEARWPEAKAEFRRALDLDPLASFTNFAYAFALLASGEPVEAVAQYRKTIELKNLHPDMYWDLGMALSFAGRKTEAADALRQANRMRGDQSGRLYGLQALFAGDTARALADAQRSEARAKAGDHPDPVDMARLHAMLGNHERAIDWMELAIREKNPQAILAKADPRLRSLQTTPRYQALLRSLGL